jgi:hypothetical protein
VIFVSFPRFWNDGKGDDWKGPMSTSRSWWEIGPIYIYIVLLGDLMLNNPREFFGIFEDRAPVGRCLSGGD